MRRFFALTLMVFLVVCSISVRTTLAQESRPSQSEPSKPQKIGEITLVKEKTTKKELLDVFCHPNEVSTDSMEWERSENENEYYLVHYIQKDGTKFDIYIGYSDKCKENLMVWFSPIYVDKDNIYVNINENKSIVSDVSFY